MKSILHRRLLAPMQRWPAALRMSARAVAATVFAAGLLCSALAYRQGELALKRERMSEISTRLRAANEQLKDDLGRAGNALLAIRAAAERGARSRLAFQRLVHDQLGARRLPGLRAFGLARAVRPDQIDPFMAHLRLELAYDTLGYPYQVANPRPHEGVAYIIDYVEPVASNRQSVAMDLGAEPQLDAAIDRARDSAAPSVVALGPGSGLHTATGANMVVLLPVYQDEAGGTSYDRFIGVLFVALHGDELLDSVFPRDLQQEVSLSLSALDASGEPDGAVWMPGTGARRARATGTGAGTPAPAAEAPPMPHWQDPFLAGGVRWRLDARVLPVEVRGASTWLPWAAAGVGLLLSVSIAAFILALDGHRRRAHVRATTAERTLASREHDLDMVTTMIDDVLWTIDSADGSVKVISQAVQRITGLPPDYFYHAQLAWLKLVHRRDRVQIRRAYHTLLRDGHAELEFRLLAPNGELRWVRTRAHLIAAEGAHASAHISGISTDITERRHAYESLKRNYRALRALNTTEHLASGAASEAGLLQGLCDAMVGTGYRFAWIGLCAGDPGGGDGAPLHITPAACAGHDGGYMERLRAELAAGGAHAVAVRQVVRTRQPAVINRLQTSSVPLHRLARSKGFQAKIVLPLLHEGQLCAILSVYAEDEDAFEQAETELLSALALNAAVALHAYRERHARLAAESHLRLRQRALEACVNPILILRAEAPDFPVDYVNPACARELDLAPEQLGGRGVEILIGADRTREGARELYRALLERRAGHAVLHQQRAGHAPAWVDVALTPVKDEDGTIRHFVAVQYDVTALLKYESDLRYQATHDALTGLANRNLMHATLDAALARAEEHKHEVWLLLIDLDRFKYVNDTLGHHAGDDLLRIVGDRLQLQQGASGSVARLGGDEFVVILDGPERARLEVVSDLLAMLALPVDLQGHDYILSCSTGIAVYPRDGRDGSTLLRNADMAMYQAKGAGRNTWRFHAARVEPPHSNRLVLEAQLRRALEEGQFVLHYQPQIDMASGRVVGMESLIRWQHPLRGLLGPAEFMDVVEETDLAVPLGEWVLRTACRQNRAWHDAGLRGLRVAVNLSHRQFHNAGLVDALAKALSETGLRPDCLDLELTERIVMADVDQAVQTLHAIKHFGVKLSIDDFGTGHSSLAHLGRFPLDVLKIDRSFVRELGDSAQAEAITRSIVSLAHSLDMQVIAEGVETERQLACLKRHGCEQVQGYYFSKPLPAEDFEHYLRNNCLVRDCGQDGADALAAGDTAVAAKMAAPGQARDLTLTLL
jgi:diguanylate cyclase (GGDEF)-like protein/PAS domain S-box-containing protein